MADHESYSPRMPPERAVTLQRWHEAAYAELRARGEVEVDYLGRTFVVPADVFAPTPMSDLLGNAVLAEVAPADRVLDLGTGCGVNAILAAATSRDVVGVDVNPIAVESARANAARNGVAGTTRFLVSDVFAALAGERFDVVVIDPPFRWFEPRDALEASMADAGYRTLTRFMAEVRDHLTPRGRVLLFFGTSGDHVYLDELVARARFEVEVLASRDLVKDGLTVTYAARRLTPVRT